MERATWPEDGRVGRIAEGEFSDNPRLKEQDRLRADDFFAPDDVTPRVLDEMGVIWVDASEDEQIEKETFGIRSEWHARRHGRKRRESILRLLLGRRVPE
ncbi:hypothetical protein ABZ896_43775 [Streptomyces sp. NPDC047072]|uniref:hypothetical protein n=1 Tax=Streptomyces sp. NPDC047072 TaxID=3154809 RepID=UPI0033F7F53C